MDLSGFVPDASLGHEPPTKETRTQHSEITNKPGGLQFQYNDPLHKFPLPQWIDDFLSSQPYDENNDDKHNAMLINPNEKFIVMVCHKYKETVVEACGGITDRLTLIPYYIWLAHKTGRKLLIKHTSPFELENYFMPPSDGGFDWRLPTKLAEKELEEYASRTHKQYTSEKKLALHEVIDQQSFKSKRFIFVNTNLAIEKIGHVFEEQNPGLDLDLIWPGIFRRMFTPSKELAKVIDQHANANGLVPGEYTAAHVRARYPGRGDIKLISKKEQSGLNMKDKTTHDIVTKLGDNSIKCAFKAMPEATHVYFASDSYDINKYLMDESPYWSKHHRNSTISNNNIDKVLVMRPDYIHDAIHLEQEPTETSKPSDYNAMFIDLWILAHSRCLAQGVGGFGHFGSKLSGYHTECRLRHRSLFDYGAMLESCPTSSELILINQNKDLVAELGRQKKKVAKLEEKLDHLMSIVGNHDN
eukprot:CAMPEP_0178940722 /NCGR_PEP_ID=MMETSP0789-20121207/977_1 /TAXON_ID=3005 /ORGANISM="Rhizosolenia setigera, Strain CCMP 1694" /LENGTH=470 /DNA_ID=CAMNT_0020619813 /DNA_START=69 /DNA_END=1481 /DNA_ORIENTATION=+